MNGTLRGMKSMDEGKHDIVCTICRFLTSYKWPSLQPISVCIWILTSENQGYYNNIKSIVVVITNISTSIKANLQNHNKAIPTKILLAVFWYWRFLIFLTKSPLFICYKMIKSYIAMILRLYFSLLFKSPRTLHA